jgi:O-antigen/teichoic acid export membrane protein
MSEAIKVRKNSIFSFLSISSRLIANVVLFLAMARFYGPLVFGQFAFAHSLSLLFIMVADFGIDMLFVNEVARDRKNVTLLFRQYFTLKIVFTLIALLGMNVFVFISDTNFQGKILILLFSFYTVLTALSNFLYSLFKGFEKLEYEMKVSIFTNSLLLVVTVILLIINSGVILIAIAFVISRLLGLLIAIKYSYNILPNINFKPTLAGLISIKNKVLIFGLHLVFNYLVFQMDTVLLAMWKGDYHVGIYQAAFKLILIPLLIPEILINVLTPTLARLNVENKQQWNSIGAVMSKILYISIIPISVIIFVFAEQIINIIYDSNDYSAAIAILKILAVTLFVRINFEAFALMLTTSNRQKTRMIIVIFAALLNLLLNYYTIPKYGAYGAAIVALFTNLFVAILYWLTTLPFFYQWFIKPKVGIVFSISLLIIFLLYQVKDISMFLIAPIILIGYMFLGYYYFLNSEEKRIILPSKFRI